MAMAGRAGMIRAVNSRMKRERDNKENGMSKYLPRNHEEQKIMRERKMLNKYGLERVDQVDIDPENLKRFRPNINK